MSWIDRTAPWGARLLGVVFAVSAGEKALAPRAFEATLSLSLLVPSAWVGPSARAVIAAELSIALGMACRSTRRIAAAAGLAATLLFAAYHAWTALKGVAAPCACFGGLRLHPAILGATLALMFVSSLLVVEREARR